MDNISCTICGTQFLYMADLDSHMSLPHPDQTAQASANSKENINREGAPDGNNNAEKWKTPEERQKLCKAWCDHLEQGYSKDSFPLADEKTIRSYTEKYPVDFPSDALEQAERKNKLFWETIGINGTIGIPIKVNEKYYDKFNAQSWKFNMQNRLGWKDKTDITTDDEKIQAPVIYIPEEDPNK